MSHSWHHCSTVWKCNQLKYCLISIQCTDLSSTTAINKVLPATAAGRTVLNQPYFPTAQLSIIKLGQCILHVSTSCKLSNTDTQNKHTLIQTNFRVKVNLIYSDNCAKNKESCKNHKQLVITSEVAQENMILKNPHSRPQRCLCSNQIWEGLACSLT